MPFPPDSHATGKERSDSNEYDCTINRPTHFGPYVAFTESICGFFHSANYPYPDSAIRLIDYPTAHPTERSLDATQS